MEQILTRFNANPMKSWMKKISFLITAGVVYLIGQYLRGQWFVNTKFDFLCHPYIENGSIYCHSLYQNAGFLLIAVGEVLAIEGLILLFANEKGFHSWWRFSRLGLPITVFIIIFLANSLALPITGLVSPEPLVWLFGFIYILITLIIIIKNSFTVRRHEKHL